MTDHFEYKLQEQELIDDFENILSAMDQPTIDGVNTYFVSKAAASFGLKVVLSGLGGDELFGGYSNFYKIPRVERYLENHKIHSFSQNFTEACRKGLEGRIPAKGFELLLNSDEKEAAYKLFRGLYTNAELRQIGWNYNSQYDVFNKDSNNFNSLTLLQRVSYLESSKYMANQLLNDSDVFSMTHSLELRVPFVDHLLYSSALPYLDDGYQKNIPKNMLVNGVYDLPEEIIFRPKMGFTFPFSDWIKKGKLKSFIAESLSNKDLNSILDQKGLDNVFKDFENNKAHWSRVWALFVISKFF